MILITDDDKENDDEEDDNKKNKVSTMPIAAVQGLKGID